MAKQVVRDDPGPELTGGTIAARGVKIAGEAILAPGASLILDGRVMEGGAHVVGAMLARWALGPIGWILVAGNSYCKSVTGKHLHRAVIDTIQDIRAGRAGEPVVS